MRMFIPLVALLLAGFSFQSAWAQPTFPENGVVDPRQGYYAFTHATVVQHSGSTLTNATLVIRDGKIVAVGTGLPVPVGAVEIDCTNKFIYPSFIDLYADYGMPASQNTGRGGGFNFAQPAQLETATKGPFGWNQAIRPEVNAYASFSVNDAQAKSLREAGFGTVLTHVRDGIARGTGALVTLATEKENLVVIKERASAHYSFSKGTSTQSYPSSMMGSISLLRQTYLDADWYKTKPAAEGTNLSLKAFNETRVLPQIF